MVGGVKWWGGGRRSAQTHLASWWVEVRIGLIEEVTFQQTLKEVGD